MAWSFIHQLVIHFSFVKSLNASAHLMMRKGSVMKEQRKRVVNGTDVQSTVVETLTRHLTTDWLQTLIEGHKLLGALPDEFQCTIMDKGTNSKYSIHLKAEHDMSEEQFNQEVEKGINIELARKAQGIPKA